MKKLNKQDMIDILYGCAVLGTGGGGSLKEGLEIMQPDFDAGRELLLAKIEEIPDDKYVATTYGCGAPAADGQQEDVAYKKLPHIKCPASELAFRSLEEYLGEKIYVVSSTELGGSNTAEALHTACLLGIPIADGDPAGRSVPELQHSSYYIYNKSISPLAVASNFGDVVILKDVVDDFRAEEIVRALAVASGDVVGVCDHPMRGIEYKNSIIPGAISYSLQIGKILREAKELAEDVSTKIAEKMNGKVAFRGNVTKMPWECRDGFNFGKIFIEGKGQFLGEIYEILFKNENYASYKNGEIDVTVPDLICMIGGNGNPITTPNFEVGDDINVLILPAPEVWKTDKGLEIFGPKHFGLEVEYVPFHEKRSGL